MNEKYLIADSLLTSDNIRTTIKECGNVIEIMTCLDNPQKGVIKHIGAKQYINTQKLLIHVGNNNYLSKQTGIIYHCDDIGYYQTIKNYSDGKSEILPEYNYDGTIHNKPDENLGNGLYRHEGHLFEIKNFNEMETRADDLKSLAATFKRIRDIVNTNTEYPKRCKWLTLTYVENMTDCKRLYNDVKYFISKMRDYIGEFEYVQVIEPQGRGAWHVHMIMIFEKQAPFIPFKKIAELWGNGSIDIQAVDNNDGIGNYLSVYLTDLLIDAETNIEEGDEIVEHVINGKNKRFLKGGRIKLYPSGMHLYRCSRGVKYPHSERCSAAEAAAAVHGLIQTYEKTVLMLDSKTGFNNVIRYEYYNKKRTNERG